MYKEIDVYDYMNDIIKGLKKGVLLTTKSGDKVNSMAISWGKIGIEWHKLIFVTYVRENRFTKRLLDENAEFTINIPISNNASDIIKRCGTVSGKDSDKISDLKLDLAEPRKISVPGIKQLPLTLECKVIYKQFQDKNELSDEIKKRFYPSDVDSSFCGANKDYHIAFYGEIVDAYIIE